MHGDLLSCLVFWRARRLIGVRDRKLRPREQETFKNAAHENDSRRERFYVDALLCFTPPSVKFFLEPWYRTGQAGIVRRRVNDLLWLLEGAGIQEFDGASNVASQRFKANPAAVCLEVEVTG